MKVRNSARLVLPRLGAVETPIFLPPSDHSVVQKALHCWADSLVVHPLAVMTQPDDTKPLVPPASVLPYGTEDADEARNARSTIEESADPVGSTPSPASSTSTDAGLSTESVLPTCFTQP